MFPNAENNFQHIKDNIILRVSSSRLNQTDVEKSSCVPYELGRYTSVTYSYNMITEDPTTCHHCYCLLSENYIIEDSV